MARTVPKKIVWSFGVGFAILVINALIDYQSFVTLTQATNSVQIGLQSRDVLKGVRSAIAGSESGQRNYILTEKKDYLESSLELLKSADSQLSGELRRLNGVEETNETRHLQELISERAAQFERALEHFADSRVRPFRFGVRKDPGVNSRPGGQESGDRVRDGNAPHLSVLGVPECQIAVLAVVPAQRQDLADTGAGNQREFQQRLELRHLLAGVEQPSLLIR